MWGEPDWRDTCHDVLNQRIGDANDVAAYEREDEGVIDEALYPGTDHAHDHHRPHIEAKRTVA